MYWSPDSLYQVAKQRQRELIEHAERVRLAASVRPESLGVRAKRAWKAMRRVSLHRSPVSP